VRRGAAAAIIEAVEVVRTAPDAARRVKAAKPVSRALVPQWVARLLGLAALASLGALEWQRLIAWR